MYELPTLNETLLAASGDDGVKEVETDLSDDSMAEAREVLSPFATMMLEEMKKVGLTNEIRERVKSELEFNLLPVMSKEAEQWISIIYLLKNNPDFQLVVKKLSERGFTSDHIYDLLEELIFKY